MEKEILNLLKAKEKLNIVVKDLVPKFEADFSLSSKYPGQIESRIFLNCPIYFKKEEIEINNPKEIAYLFLHCCIHAYRDMADLADQTVQDLKHQLEELKCTT